MKERMVMDVVEMIGVDGRDNVRNLVSATDKDFPAPTTINGDEIIT